MTDRLTQLQNAVDQLATQCFSALRYISDHHVALPSTPTEPLAADVDEGRVVDTPDAFSGAKTELARDLIMKTKQVEVLITNLPGIGISEDEQEKRLRGLERELKEAEVEREAAVREREEARERLEEVLRGLRRV